ncbi:dihydrofolate reductase [Lachnospiraceae bacterium]|nr:dihydrofolate reductase [Lachnospiraceae bacterium]
MNLIAAVDKNWGIGLNNALLVRIPDDMKRFRQITTGNVVVMGRKTLESFPGGQPLKNRVNIVVTSDREYQVKDAVCVHSMEELAQELEKYKSDQIYIIGGESIYRQLLEQCDTALITKIEYEYQADAWFPDLDQMTAWELTQQSEEQTYFDLEYYFCKYERKRI